MRRLAGLQAAGHDHGVAVEVAVLLHGDGVGPRRHRRAGEDARGRAGRQVAGIDMAGGNAQGDRQAATGRDIIGMGEGEAVDGGVVGQRHVARRDDRLGKDPTVAGADRHVLGGGDRNDARLEQRQCLVVAHQALVDAEAAVVGVDVVSHYPVPAAS